MLSFQLLTILAIALAKPRVALAQEVNNTETAETKSLKERMIVQSFLDHRKDRLLIVNELREKDGEYENQYKMISMVVEHAVSTIETSRPIIQDKKFIPGDNGALENSTVNLALSTVLENSVLFNDVILHFPEITKRMLRSKKNYNATLDWSLRFINGTRHLMDKSSIEKLKLVHQELYMTPRQQNHTNPYSKTDDKMKTRTKQKKETKNKETRRRGPRLFSSEL